MNNGKVISLQKVSKHYQRGAETVHALQDVTLDIAQGEYVAIAGHSGSGKTTLLNLIGCLDHPTSGRIAVNGPEIQKAGEKELTQLRQTAIGFVFQQFFLIPTLTVIENVQLPALFTGRKVHERAKELLKLVGLSKRMNHLPAQLSGGEMQRVAIARSLINSPPILLADEPTGNLDSRNADTIIDLFETLNRDGMTVVLVTHNLDLVKRCSRRVHIEDGVVKI
ncbi:MAG: ATP-binding cassette domain-containing protein [Chitinivibrionales bacterium]|nr:ATP-binding cassette domain-containing protein [Chitinivibrionales bacterium]MBD3356388.1 ATP-binding cassette domain-containing protein [Chitinivibrionales bacterium]